MEFGGTFQYQPGFEIEKESAEELLDLEQIKQITDSTEICETIVDFVFDDVDAQIIYGEVGNEEKTAKFFLRTVIDDSGNPEEIKVFVPDKQEKYPNAGEYWAGFSQGEGGLAEKVNQVQSIAENFRTGDVIIIDAAEIAEQQDG